MWISGTAALSEQAKWRAADPGPFTETKFVSKRELSCFIMERGKIAFAAFRN
jgi:hypothetical protein